MRKVKQVIIIRKDLGMRQGKSCSQASHASMAALIFPEGHLNDEIPVDGYHYEENASNGEISNRFLITHGIDDACKQWLDGSFAKICLYCNSEEELLELKDKAKAKNIRHAIIKDQGLTEFNGVPTYTSLAIGPFYSDEIDEITGNLKLL